MSQISGPGISITFASSGDQVVTESSRVRAAVVGTSDKIVEANERIVQSNNEASESITQSAMSFSRFGRMAIGGFGLFGLIRIVDGIGQSFVQAAKEAENFSSGLNDRIAGAVAALRSIGAGEASDYEKRIKELRARTKAEIDKIRSDLETLAKSSGGLDLDQQGNMLRAIGSAWNEITGAASSYREQVEAANKTIAGIIALETRALQALERENERRMEQESLDAAKRIQAEAARIRLQSLEEYERVEAEAVQRLDDLQRQLNEARTREERNALLSMYNAVADSFGKRLADLRKKEAEDRRREDEKRRDEQRRFDESQAAAAARQQERVASAIQSAANALADAAARLSDVTTDVSGIRNVVETRLQIGGGRR